MPIKFKPISGNFNDVTYKVLEVLESPTIELKYFIHPKVLTTTIGIGFDLEKASEDEKQAVYRALGFDVDGAWPGTKPAVGSPLHTEQQYLKRILDLVAAGTHTQPPFRCNHERAG